MSLLRYVFRGCDVCRATACFEKNVHKSGRVSCVPVCPECLELLSRVFNRQPIYSSRLPWRASCNTDTTSVFRQHRHTYNELNMFLVNIISYIAGQRHFCLPTARHLNPHGTVVTPAAVLLKI